jgi:hypothetical protein
VGLSQIGDQDDIIIQLPEVSPNVV